MPKTWPRAFAATTEAWLIPPKNWEFGNSNPSLGLEILALAIAYAKTLHAIITAAHFGDHWKVAGSAAANKVEIMDTGSNHTIFVDEMHFSKKMYCLLRVFYLLFLVQSYKTYCYQGITKG